MKKGEIRLSYNTEDMPHDFQITVSVSKILEHRPLKWRPRQAKLVPIEIEPVNQPVFQQPSMEPWSPSDEPNYQLKRPRKKSKKPAKIAKDPEFGWEQVKHQFLA